MEYIVLDMEWNQALNFSEMVKDPVFLTGEIIQIGAIKLNQTLEVVDSFNERIAPQYYTELHPKVADSFWTGAEFAAILFLIVGACDTFFLDWVLFAHLKVFRLPGTEHMDKAYAQKWFHVKGMLFPGSLFLVIISMLTGLLVMWVK